MVKEIPLNSRKYPGHVILVDDEDFDTVNQFTWSVCRSKRKNGPDRFYAHNSTHSVGPDGKQRTHNLMLHHLLMPGLKGIDHVDGNGLNNQRSNLRPATKSQNAANWKAMESNASSRYRGVSWFKQTNRWRAVIKVNYKFISLGYFKSEEDAARAYDEAARLHFGEFASPNFV